MLFGKYINRYYLKYLHLIIFGLIALVAVDAFQLEIPKLYKYLINGITYGEVELNGQVVPFDFNFLLDQICMPMLFIILSLVLGRFLWRICFFGSGIRVETDLRSKMFDHSKNLSQQYYQVNKVGNLMALFTNDIETVQDCFGSGILMFADALFLGGLSLIKMAIMDPVLTVLSLIPMAFMLTIVIIVGKYMSKKWERRQEAFSSLSDFSQESFSGIAVIKAFVKEFKELMAFKKLNSENEIANVEYTKASTLLRIFVTLFVESVVCIILGYGGYLVYKGTFNAGELMEFIGYFNSIVWPVMAISELIELQSRGKASLKRITELLDAKQDVIDAPDATAIGALKGDIEFKNLTFRYPDGDYDALLNINVKINAGEHVGIIGKTGSGKTTLVDLILRNYNVQDGTLFVDGLDVNDITIHSLRENTAYVPQDNFLFSDTIQNNIAFASDTNDLDAVKHFARLAAVDDNIEEFNDGYSTMLGERGVTVSGGQKQRISIARALMKDAPILILDDSLSAVDTKTEKTLIDNLRSSRAGKTTILIAHRISTIENMDKIIFIDDGKVIAYGTHENLYNDCVEYRNMVELQKLEDEKEG
ncbi:MAG: ABC transporter ATP-binding protein [Clostridiales bacterium]|nr:ABC transporter ATP-binding protein [Clostridiales bacterium]